MFKSVILAAGLALTLLALILDTAGSEPPDMDERSHLGRNAGVPVGPYL